MTQNGLQPLCMSGTTERGGKGLIVHKRLIWTSPVAHLQLPVHRGRKEPRDVPPAGRRPPIGSTHCEVALPLCSSRARPTLRWGVELWPPQPDSDTSPSPHSSPNATSLLVIDVQLVCTLTCPHCHVILLSTYNIMQHTITDSVKSCFQEGGVF